MHMFSAESKAFLFLYQDLFSQGTFKYLAIDSTMFLSMSFEEKIIRSIEHWFSIRALKAAFEKLCSPLLFPKHAQRYKANVSGISSYKYKERCGDKAEQVEQIAEISPIFNVSKHLVQRLS